eukprot:1130039-Rhodomonas_salina.3
MVCALPRSSLSLPQTSRRTLACTVHAASHRACFRRHSAARTRAPSRRPATRLAYASRKRLACARALSTIAPTALQYSSRILARRDAAWMRCAAAASRARSSWSTPSEAPTLARAAACSCSAPVRTASQCVRACCILRRA